MNRLFLLLALVAWLPLQAINFNISSNGTTLPVPLSLPSSNAIPQIAVSPNGQAMAIWVNWPNQTELQGQFFDGTNWVPLTGTGILNQVTTSGFLTQSTFAFGSAPKLVIDQFGNATVAYVTSNQQIFAAHFIQNSLPAANVVQLSTPGTVNISPSIAVNLNGFALAVWIQNAPYQVLSRVYLPATNIWNVAEIFLPFPPRTTGTYPASFGLGNNNIGTAVWLEATTGLIFGKSFSIP